MLTAKTLIRLGAHAILLVLSCGGSTIQCLDGWVRVLRPFNSISVISRRLKDEHERLCAMKRRLGSGRISPPAGIEPATPWSEVGSANRSATRTLQRKKHFPVYIYYTLRHLFLTVNSTSCLCMTVVTNGAEKIWEHFLLSTSGCRGIVAAIAAFTVSFRTSSNSVYYRSPYIFISVRIISIKYTDQALCITIWQVFIFKQELH